MVVTFNSANFATKGYSTSFGNSQAKPRVINTELLTQEVKSAKKSGLGRMLRNAVLALGITSSAILASCEKNDDIIPEKPPIVVPTDTIPTGSKELSATEKSFLKTAKNIMAIDPNETAMIDSVLVNDGYSGQNIAWKIDADKSTKDTIVVKETVLSGTDVMDYGVLKFHNDKEGSLVSDNYYSKNFKYNDPEQVYYGVTKYIEDGASVVTENYGMKDFRYSFIDAQNVLKQNIEQVDSKAIVKRLFLSLKK